MDGPLLAALLLLSAISLILLFSSSGGDVDLILRQSARLVVGLAAALVFSRIAVDTLRRWSPHAFLLGLVLLGLVLGVGIIGKGAQRWLDLGILRFQPAEIMKVAAPMMVAWMLTRKPLPAGPLVTLAAIAVVLVPAAMVMIQPDLGTAILIAISGLLVIFMAGLKWRYIAVAVCLALAAAPLMWFKLLKPYQQNRILTLFDPYSDPLGAGYHSIQSAIAVGSGGFFGKGWVDGTQSQLEFIPERNTDFVFAVYAEEFGLLGCVLLLMVYLFVVGRSLVIAFNARDNYARLLCASLALTFFVYVFVNIGMVTGVLPIVGVPLPLISYGGTSMVTLMAGFGIVMSARSRRRLMA